MEPKLITLPDDLQLVCFSYLQKKSLKRLAKSCKSFLKLLSPIIRELVSKSQRAREARNALKASRSILRYIWDPVRIDGLPGSEYDAYLPKIFITGSITPLTIDQYVLLLEEAERIGWDSLIGEESDRLEAARKLYDLHLYSINLKDPEILTQLALMAFDLWKNGDAILFSFAVCCFIEVTLCFPSFSRGHKNLRSAINAVKITDRTRFRWDIPFFHTAEEIQAAFAKYASLPTRIDMLRRFQNN